MNTFLITCSIGIIFQRVKDRNRNHLILLRKTSLYGIVLLFLLSSPVLSGPARERSSGFSPDRSQLQQHVHFLSSDELKGRGPGTQELDVASRYISSRFRSWGLKSVSSDPEQPSYVQTVPLRKIAYRARLKVNGPADRALEITAPVFKQSTLPASGMGSARKLVFAGYGIRDTKRGYNDYKQINVEGKYVVLFRHAPNERDPDSVFDGSLWSSGAHLRKKYRLANEQGAAGVFLINDPLGDHKRLPDRVHSSRWSFKGSGHHKNAADSIPFVALSPTQGAKLLGLSTAKLRQLQQRINQGPTPQSYKLDKRSVSVSVYREVVKQFTIRNVIGYLPGAKSEGQNEHIVIGAHYDHLGTRSSGEDRIYNGADDNASGTAAVLELARMFARSDRTPERSLVFVLFSGEELGLFGSKYYVQHPALPLNNMVAMINFDMVGRNDGQVSVYGAKENKTLRRWNRRVNRQVTDTNFRSRKRSQKLNSDHTVFARNDVPVLFYFTGYGEHYHRVSDEVDGINFHGLQDVVHHAARMIDALGSSSVTPGRNRDNH